MRTEEGNLYVHRMVYELAYGEIEPGFDLHHECENKRCANPYHVRLITRGEHCLIHMPPGCRWEKARAREAA